MRWTPLGLVMSVAGVLAFASPAVASTNLVINGDFSAPVVGTGSNQFFANDTSFDGWRVVGATGNVAVQSGAFAQNGFSFGAYRSAQWLDLTGDSNTKTGVEQTVATVPGLAYRLTFATGNVYNPGGIFGVRSSVGVLVNGKVRLVTNNAKGRGTTRQIWTNYALTFTATTSATRLEFLNDDPASDTENGLDDVSLTPNGPVVGPSTIATSIPTPRQALFPLSTLAVNGGIAAAIALLLTFPSQLFNQTLQENYADLALWWRRKLRWLRLPSRSPANAHSSVGSITTSSGYLTRDAPYLERRSVFALVFVGGALVNAFNDGSFGLSWHSLVTFIGVVIALALGVAIPTWVAGLYHSMRHGTAPRKLMALPVGLALAVVMVLFSRLINFEPGYLYGFVCGVLFTRELASNEKGHLAALSVCTTLVVSALAWIAWIPVNAAALRPNAFVGVVLADDVLGALFVSGLVGSFFGMLPIRGLPGWTVKQWSNWAWVFGFGVSILGLFQILLRPGIAGHGHRPLITSIVLFVLFGAGSVLFHEHFERRRERARGRTTSAPNGPLDATSPRAET